MLDAAEGVVLSEGIGRLTLDAVAKRMGMSKAGLLHHFPSKSELVRAMVARHMSQWHEEYRAAYEQLRDAGDPMPAVRALMSTCMAGTEAWTEAERARNRVMVAALVHHEEQVEPLIKVDCDVTALLKKDALPPGVAEIIHLAVHGLWFQWIFGMGSVSENRLKVIRAALNGLMESAADEKKASGARSRVRGVR